MDETLLSSQFFFVSRALSSTHQVLQMRPLNGMHQIHDEKQLSSVELPYFFFFLCCGAWESTSMNRGSRRCCVAEAQKHSGCCCVLPWQPCPPVKHLLKHKVSLVHLLLLLCVCVCVYIKVGVCRTGSRWMQKSFWISQPGGIRQWLL